MKILSLKGIFKIHDEDSGGRARLLSTLALSTNPDNLMRRIIWIGTVRNSVAKKKKKRQCCKQCTQVIITVVNTNIILTHANRPVGKELPIGCTLWPNVRHDMQESTL